MILQWHRRPNHAITTDNAGNVFYVGYYYCSKHRIDSCYSGTKIWMSLYALVMVRAPGAELVTGVTLLLLGIRLEPLWKQAISLATGSIPVPDDSLYWDISYSNHLNAVVDNSGRLSFQLFGVETALKAHGLITITLRVYLRSYYWPVHRKRSLSAEES
jgi:hypothetical protein